MFALFLGVSLAWGVLPAFAQAEDKGEGQATGGESAALSFEDEFEAEFAEEDMAAVADPLRYWNVAWFHFNDKLHYWVLKPVSKGWDFVFPDAVQRSIDHFLTNLGFPARFLNTLLQGRPRHTATETARFVTNTTVGLLGLMDPATTWLELKRYDEDFDQTLGYYGIGMGVFLTWPFFGPSSLRGTVALPVDSYTRHPLPGSGFIDRVNKTSLGQNPYDSLRELAVDPYTAIRDAYVQNRRKAIKDVGQE